MHDIALAILTIGFFYLAEYSWHSFFMRAKDADNLQPGMGPLIYLIAAVISLLFFIF